MKFYKRFPGDITIKTGDLTLTEFGAYDRLLDHYYAKERPIDPDRVYTVARCQSAADRRAVDRVLQEFWTLTDLGWVQERADEMIAEALPRIEAARVNGKKGGRPKKAEDGREKKPTGFPKENPARTQREPRRKASQIPEPKRDSLSKPPPPPLPGGAVADSFAEFWSGYPASERKVAEEECRKKWQRMKLDAIAAEVLAGLRRWVDSAQWQRDGGAYIPAPLTWLKQRRWEAEISDEIAAADAQASKAYEANQQYLDEQREHGKHSQSPAAIAAREVAKAKAAELRKATGRAS